MLRDRPAIGAPPATVGDAAQLLDVHTHQLAGSAALVALCAPPRRTNQLARERIALCQMWHVMPGQDRADGTWRDAQFGADPVWPTPLLAPRLEHTRLDLGGCTP